MYRRISLTAICAVAAAACGVSSDAATAFGTWTSPDGYVVKITASNRFEFCDRSKCHVGIVKRVGNASSYNVVVLREILSFANAGRFRHQLYASAGEWRGYRRDYPNLEFSVAGGAGARRVCGARPCALFGKLDDPRKITFYRG